MEKKNLMLISPMLHQGGFERVCVKTARLLSEDFHVTIVIFDSADIAYDISGLEVVDLKLGASRTKAGKAITLMRRIAALKALKRKLHTDISYSFGQTANLANCQAGAGDRIICSIRSYQDFDNPGKISLFCKKADQIACCSGEIEKKIREEFGCDKTYTLYNPVSIPKAETEGIRAESAEWSGELRSFLAAHGERLIMTMGRADDIKGFWHLIKAFSALRRLERCGLVIIGEGDFQEYRKLAAELQVGEDVFFTGVMKNPFPLVRRASLYTLTSFMEGFPNALVEAMALGVPVIAADCPTGPREILKREDETYGILIPVLDRNKNLDPGIITEEEELLAARMQELLNDPGQRAALRKKGQDRAADFSDEAYAERCIYRFTQGF